MLAGWHFESVPVVKRGASSERLEVPDLLGTVAACSGWLVLLVVLMLAPLA